MTAPAWTWGRIIVTSYDHTHGHYEARYEGTNAPVGIGDDQHEAVEMLMRAARKVEA